MKQGTNQRCHSLARVDFDPHLKMTFCFPFGNFRMSVRCLYAVECRTKNIWESMRLIELLVVGRCPLLGRVSY